MHTDPMDCETDALQAAKKNPGVVFYCIEAGPVSYIAREPLPGVWVGYVYRNGRFETVDLPEDDDAV